MFRHILLVRVFRPEQHGEDFCNNIGKLILDGTVFGVWTDIESFILLNPWIASNKSSPKEIVEKNTMMKETATCLENKGDSFSALNFMTMTMLSVQV